jgi:hypothetical protein
MRGERASALSDIYALGVVLYELLTGRRPFHGDTPYATAVDRLNRPPPDPRALQPDVPDGIAEIVMRAMALEPRDRYPTAAALERALRAWADRPAAVPAVLPIPRYGAAGAATDDPVPAASVREPRRLGGSGRAWGVAVLLVALLIGGYLGGRLIGGEEVADVLPDVIVGSPGGVAFPHTPTPQPSAATVAPTPSDEPEPSAATPVPAPTAPPATPSPATPAPVAVAAPGDTVAAFYGHVVDARFDEAYALWSDRMKAEYPREENLDDRFDSTASITFDQLFVASQSAGEATVQANFTERYDNGSSRQFIGYWRLVRVDGRWLLDEPTY